jgi:hypothetical protein
MYRKQPGQPPYLPDDDRSEASATGAIDDGAMTKRQSRRLLLRAAAATPIIYTLPVGATVATSSTCFDKPDNFEQLSDEQKDQFNEGELQPGDELGHGYVVYSDGVQKVKESCWSSLNPGAPV